ncbi:MAG: hypothetical protein NTU83_11315 [Candidatus Hydrogenedentes bacterium]|nr:hypothetical protein [Candidatus Hydrogenedentota bacterium]
MRPEIERRGIGVRDQGTRPTCSVHAMTFLLEWLYTGMCGSKWNDLSEEYLNHMTNVATGKTDDGDFFQCIHQGFLQYGMIRESALPYEKDRVYDFAEVSIPSSLIEDGKQFLKDAPAVKGRFIKEWSKAHPGLSEAQLAEMLDYLRRNIPVAIGRDHSTVAVGFELDKAQPGGGLFIIRDSRGRESGDQGYLTESFQSVKTTAYDVFVYEKE